MKTLYCYCFVDEFEILAFYPKREKKKRNKRKRKQNIENLKAVMGGEQERSQLLVDEDILFALYRKSPNKVNISLLVQIENFFWMFNTSMCHPNTELIIFFNSL